MTPHRVLLVKTSSMGDLVHTLSALEDVRARRPDVIVDWVCEEAFQDIAGLSPCVGQVIPVAIRRWRRHWWAASTWREWRAAVGRLRAVSYDAVVDAQGLIKSSWITALARCSAGERWGYDRHSIREPAAGLVLDQRVSAPRDLPAIERLRRLFGRSLGYTPEGPVSWLQPPAPAAGTSTILFLHGTSRQEKSWPVPQWIELGRALIDLGFRIELPWGSDHERLCANSIADALGHCARVIDKSSIRELADRLIAARGAIGVDTGLMHLSVALGRPTVAVMSAAHIEKFSAKRFAPLWAPHARVVESQAKRTVLAADVLRAWQDLA